MKIEKILSHQPKVLSDAQRNSYFKDGYLVLDRFVSDEWLDRLWAVTCLLYTSPSPRDRTRSRMPSSA